MFDKQATIKKCKKSDFDSKRPKSEQVWCVYTKDGSKLLGRHPTKESAQKQLAAIEIHKKGNLLGKIISMLKKLTTR